MSQLQINDHPVEVTMHQPDIAVNAVYPQLSRPIEPLADQPIATNNTQESPVKALASTLYGRARLQFIRKVFAILTLQLMVTVGMILASMFSEVFLRFQANYHWLMYVCIVLSIATLVIGIWPRFSRRPPYNYVNLLIFTGSLSYIVSFLCSITDQWLVLMAGLETLSVVAIAVAFALFSREEYKTGWACLSVLIMSLICLSVSMPLFYQTHAAACGICWVVNFIFAIQLVFDVEMVMDSDRGLEIDDYIPAAMIIYFDMIMLFIRLLGSGRRR